MFLKIMKNSKKILSPSGIRPMTLLLAKVSSQLADGPNRRRQLADV